LKILLCGDVVGRSGREVILEHIPSLRKKFSLDFVAVNGENAAAGFGITEKICKQFYEVGVDAITLGNHSFDNRDIISKVDQDPKLIRPANYPKGSPGHGYGVFQTPKGRKVAVINVLCRLFMELSDDPFACLNEFLDTHRLGQNVDAVIIDSHGEATSEKMAMGHFVDGRASMLVGTHTHVPTADTQILSKGTAYQTDVGMCGDYNSVIGMDSEIPIIRFTRKIPTERLKPAEGPATLCAVYVETDDKTGLAKVVAPLRIGGQLSETIPEVG
jgi:metallophosphoesterase (TIGR00282 family)